MVIVEVPGGGGPSRLDRQRSLHYV
jgi:hypothetical protein